MILIHASSLKSKIKSLFTACRTWNGKEACSKIMIVLQLHFAIILERFNPRVYFPMQTCIQNPFYYSKDV